MDEMDDEGCEVDIRDLQDAVAELSIHSRLACPQWNDRTGDMSSGTELSCSPTSDGSDVIGEYGGASGGRRSPTASGITNMRLRMGRSPRRRQEDDQYVHPLSQGFLTNLTVRRRSDPGRISVSPLRSRVRVDCDISEDGDFEEERKARIQKLARWHNGDVDTEMAAMPGSPGILRSRSRSPQLHGRVRAIRSHSLPCSDPALMDVGEAIGAVALSRPEMPRFEIAHDPLHGKVNLASIRRRRSVSVECTSPLEAIMEENDKQKNSRRFSTPIICAAERANQSEPQ